LLEDVTTIYVYVIVSDLYDNQNFADYMNLITSIASGGISCILILITTAILFRDCQVCCSNAMLYWIIGITAVYAPAHHAFNRLVWENPDMPKDDSPQIALLVSSFFGYFFFGYLSYHLYLCYYREDYLLLLSPDKGEKEIGGDTQSEFQKRQMAEGNDSILHDHDISSLHQPEKYRYTSRSERSKIAKEAAFPFTNDQQEQSRYSFTSDLEQPSQIMHDIKSGFPFMEADDDCKSLRC
jgi:hypothetical protein